MRQQTKPFIVEIKQSRKLKGEKRETGIWKGFDLAMPDGSDTIPVLEMEPVAQRDDQP